MDYKELFEAWRKERKSDELQALPGDFYARLSAYLRVLEESYNPEGKSVKERIVAAEYELAKLLAVKLIQARRKKILKGIEGEGLLTKSSVKEEEELQKGLMSAIGEYDKLIEGVLRGKFTGTRGSEMILVRFLQPLPAIVGVDMKTYGPFRPEDVAMLPAENAKILLEKGVAVKLEANKSS